MGTVRERGSWTGSAYAYTDLGESIATLSASPLPSAGPVSWVRILVGGKIVAEARNDEDTGAVGVRSRRTLAVEAIISHPQA